ncbi:NAD(P)/FAD-dependent oxidoreductase [Cerasicoccus maritimus]|uniref:NAD(P)/FAD-dependent oxidoreductase n=1 Tax=Cerasicoccus maritimus TaxID=490089 RepID=UPI002852C77F|nr:FAD-dependent oxidoreductase [Cerasicoccus maritimus]
MTQTLIVGQGMAGSVLAWELHQHGHAIRVIDDGHRTSASLAAAGMVNPVQGQRLKLAWRIEDCLPVAHQFFEQVEKEFGETFFHRTPILRLVNNEKEKDFLDQRLADERYQPFLGEYEQPGANTPLHDDFGGIRIKHAGYVSTAQLLIKLREYFEHEGILCDAEFTHNELSVDENGVRWRDLSAERIVFAEGFRILDNPWFSDFNFQPNKGEILTIQSDQPLPDIPVNRGKWIIPQGKGAAWCGSTYGRGQTDSETTEAGAADIMAKVANTMPSHEFKIVDHRAGVRCATGDHIPRAGFHPEHPRIGVFNGFGSKGNVFIPWLAQRMAEHLITGASLPEDCDFRARPPRKKRQA